MEDGEHELKLFNDMKQVVSYKDGEKHGKETYWYPNGQKASESFWENGKMEGESISWTENGVMVQKDTYRNDMLHGKCSIWNEQGQLESEMMFEEGRPFGKFTHYKDGVKIKEGIAEYPKGESPYNFDNETIQ
jgi:antitoxin component YwqK of YwqJK toxin-antitoxin module